MLEYIGRAIPTKKVSLQKHFNQSIKVKMSRK